MLVHEALDRARQVARHWYRQGCPIVIHADSRVPAADFEDLKTSLGDLADIHFVDRRRCDWGTWSLVDATQAAVETLLDAYPDVTHAYLASGACLPLRPVADLNRYLAIHPGVDFIESVAIEDVPWAKGGLDEERFRFGFPFAWKRSRRLFDVWVKLQRAVGRHRACPEGLRPHLGSQWWCLTRETLETIRSDPERPALERYFRRVWIPDESYYQTMVRYYGRAVQSQSLTLSKFDHQGKPHIFYDDHLEMLERSNGFVARKIWPDASGLYDRFLRRPRPESPEWPQPKRIDRAFARSLDRRIRGRDGLYSAFRFPHPTRGIGLTAAGYAAFEGFDDVFEAFPDWAEKAMRLRMHGHLFGPDRVEFAGGQSSFAGGLSDNAKLRDYNAEAFLTSLIWNTRGETQGFLYGPRDTPEIGEFLAGDQNARIYAVSGAWAARLFRSGLGAQSVRKEAALLQKQEAAHLSRLRWAETRARVRIWTLAEFLDQPSEVLQTLIEENGPTVDRPMVNAPLMHDLTGLAGFLQDLKNLGMNPHLAGDVAEIAGQDIPKAAPRIVL